MRLTVVLAVLMLTSAKVVSDDKAYILIDAVRTPSTFQQPTWIGLHKHGSGRRVIHVPVGKGIAAVEPGRYKIAHIDFQKSSRSGAGTIDIPASESKSFDVSVDAILFVGLLEIDQKGTKDEVRLASSGSQDMLRAACQSEPEVFKRLPVLIVTKEKTTNLVRLSCDT